jgi:glycosyltransferase involved in cell wall biosynthesis
MSQSYKLLFLLPTFVFGGAERTSLNLLNGIDKNRFRISLVTSRSIFQYFQHIDIENFIAVEDIGIDVWFGSLKRFMQDIKRTADLLKAENPDLAFGMMHYPSSLLVFAKHFFHVRTKVIASPRGPSTEYLRYFEHNLLRKACLRRIFYLFLRYADGVVVNSTGMKGECIRDFHVKEKRISVIPNSVDVQAVREMSGEDADINIEESFLVFSAAGRLEKEKNLPFLLRTFSQVRKKIEAKLLIIGEGSEKVLLQNLSAELGIADDVIFVGYQRNPYKYIVKSDIFVHTCLFEGFPNIVLEAMAFGVPVVTMDCPYGPRDIIKHGENGFLVPMNDERALVDTLLKLANNKELRDLTAKKGFERVMDFSIKKMVDGYESFFCNIAHNS